MAKISTFVPWNRNHGNDIGQDLRTRIKVRLVRLGHMISSPPPEQPFLVKMLTFLDEQIQSMKRSIDSAVSGFASSLIKARQMKRCWFQWMWYGDGIHGHCAYTTQDTDNTMWSFRALKASVNSITSEFTSLLIRAREMKRHWFQRLWNGEQDSTHTDFNFKKSFTELMQVLKAKIESVVSTFVSLLVRARDMQRCCFQWLYYGDGTHGYCAYRSQDKDHTMWQKLTWQARRIGFKIRRTYRRMAHTLKTLLTQARQIKRCWVQWLWTGDGTHAQCDYEAHGRAVCRKRFDWQTKSSARFATQIRQFLRKLIHILKTMIYSMASEFGSLLTRARQIKRCWFQWFWTGEGSNEHCDYTTQEQTPTTGKFQAFRARLDSYVSEFNSFLVRARDTKRYWFQRLWNGSKHLGFKIAEYFTDLVHATKANMDAFTSEFSSLLIRARQTKRCWFQRLWSGDGHCADNNAGENDNAAQDERIEDTTLENEDSQNSNTEHDGNEVNQTEKKWTSWEIIKSIARYTVAIVLCVVGVMVLDTLRVGWGKKANILTLN